MVALGCPKYLRQSFHEFADSARKWSSWSRAYCDMKRAQGMNHHAAVRSLAYKWIRIMCRLWQDRTTYSEEAYIARLRQTGSPVDRIPENLIKSSLKHLKKTQMPSPIPRFRLHNMRKIEALERFNNTEPPIRGASVISARLTQLPRVRECVVSGFYSMGW
jgi:hypothetical protein